MPCSPTPRAALRNTKASICLDSLVSSSAAEIPRALKSPARRPWLSGCHGTFVPGHGRNLHGWPSGAANTSAPPQSGRKWLRTPRMKFTRVNSWLSITNAGPKISRALWNTQKSDLPNSGASALPVSAIHTIPIWHPGSRGRRNALSSGRRGWKEKRRRGLRGHRAGVLRGRRSRRPIERFGESIKKPARRAVEGYATVAKTVEESAAVGCVELEEVRAPHQIGALRMFFLQCFGILPEETVCVHFAIEVQAGHEHQLLGLFLLIGRVTVAIPCGGQGLDRKSTRLNSSHANISYAVFCLKKKKKNKIKT